MRCGLACAFVATILFSAYGPAVAMAHPLVDEARERFRSADFPGAIGALVRAEEAHDLERADAVQIYELRALIHSALREREQADDALRALASLEPDHRFPREAPPDVVERFRRLRRTVPGRVEVEAERAETASGVRLEPRAVNDPLRVVRRLRIHARVDGGPWSSAEDEALSVTAQDGQTVEWYVVGMGPGGAEIATAGTARAPLSFTAGDDPLSGGGTGPWLWVGLGVGAAAIAAAVAIVLLTSTAAEPDTTVEGPVGFP